MSQNDFTKFFGGDFSEFFQSMPNISSMSELPLDRNKMMDSQRKNLQALTEAQTLAMEGLQAVAQRQTELLSKMVEDNSSLARDLLNEGTPEQKVAKQADLCKNIYERSIASMREVADMLNKSNQEASDIINKRVSASLAEIKKSLENSQKKAASNSSKKAA